MSADGFDRAQRAHDNATPEDHAADGRMWAEVDEHGTAMAETALCDEHHDSTGSDKEIDCTGNDALTCTECGWNPFDGYEDDPDDARDRAYDAQMVD